MRVAQHRDARPVDLRQGAQIERGAQDVPRPVARRHERLVRVRTNAYAPARGETVEDERRISPGPEPIRPLQLDGPNTAAAV